LLRKIIFLLALSFCVTCSGHGPNVFFTNDNKKLYKNSLCMPDEKMPQMIIIPFFENASQIMPNCNIYPKHKTALALMIFYHKWVEYFGDRDFAVRGMLQKVMIRWGNSKKVSNKGFSLNGELFTSRTIIGKVEGQNIIWVWRGYDYKISESSLTHELVHLALKAKFGTYDADHEGHKYRGWTPAHSAMIISARRMMRAFNI
tara:strand:+ start:5986 stop:6591 length:606 start_codon:yes stop_codon:yes gene_type:complete